ncbi:histidine phosphatase family protein [Pelomonas sp. HMWF004]|nr:histidine phosphatase family protein [Pelomonas sp. HMWF004]
MRPLAAPRLLSRRRLLLGLPLLAALPVRGAFAADADADVASADTEAQRLLQQPAGLVLLMRHATAPGGGDPSGFTLGDCSTQRNLSDEGRAQARHIGQQLRALRLPVAAVWHSQWCRTRETAELMAVGPCQPEPLFNSFFDDPGREQAFTAQARQRLAAWANPAALLVVTHQVNITALSGVFPSSGEIVAMRFDSPAGRVLGQLML